MYNVLCCIVLACGVVAIVAPRWPEEGFTCATPDFQRRFETHGIKWDSKEKTLTKNGIKKYYKDEFNSPEAERNTHDKSRTSKILREQGILVPGWHEWDHSASEIDNITAALRNTRFPLVVKPRYGQQGHGVRTELENPYEVLQAVRELQGIPIHVEEQVQGNEYRVTTFKGDIIAVTRRTGPHVVGDGRNSIEQLVRMGRSGKLAKLHTIDYNYLRRNGYSRQSIPERDEEVALSTVKNMSNGGHGTYVPLDTVHPDNTLLFKTIASTLGLHTSGIDIIMDDITSPSSETNRCYTIEVNSRPGWEGSVRDPAPDGEKTSLVDRVLSSLFD
jgi:cyanophycin synthetase